MCASLLEGARVAFGSSNDHSRRFPRRLYVQTSIPTPWLRVEARKTGPAAWKPPVN